jgi:hypothetical protein
MRLSFESVDLVQQIVLPNVDRHHQSTEGLNTTKCQEKKDLAFVLPACHLGLGLFVISGLWIGKVFSLRLN